MGFLDRVGMRWLLLSIALLPMAIASTVAVRLSFVAAETEREAQQELRELDQLIALGDFHTSVVTETASYRGWSEAIVPSDIDRTSPPIAMARVGLIRLATESAGEARDRLDEVRLGPEAAALVDGVASDLERVRATFAADDAADLSDDLGAIEAGLDELTDFTDRMVDRRSDEWTVIDLHADMMSRLTDEVFTVGTMLITGESTAELRRTGALLVSQTDETFSRFLDAVSADERASLEAAFVNDYTTDLRTTVDTLGDTFEPLSIGVIAQAPGDLERFGDAAEAVRDDRAETIHREAQERADQAATERMAMLVLAVAAIVVPGVLLFVVGRRITRRLSALTEAAKRMSQGELGVMAEGVSGTDELALLADTFNDVSATVSLGHEQISALADGRLDDPVLDQQMPGPVGHTMRVALRRLGNATAELAHHASHDRLTGLLDRRGFHLAALELDPDVEWAVMLVDLDGFKAVNDTFGHAAGDDVLVTVASRLAASVRADDVAARLGGDEFGAIVERDVAMQVADRMLLGLAQPIVVDGHPHALSASIGWTPLGRGEELGDALRRADVAMYEAKHAGHNQVRSVSDTAPLPAPAEVRATRSRS